MIDKASLWEKLKSELEAEAEGKRVREYRYIGPGENPAIFKDLGYQRDEQAQAILDRMLQMETLA